jgi:hypothetical protein
MRGITILGTPSKVAICNSLNSVAKVHNLRNETSRTNKQQIIAEVIENSIVQRCQLSF